MDYSKPTLLVISGPNGAGKSTHIQMMLPADLEGIWSFDRDKTRLKFEKQLILEGVNSSNTVAKATRIMEEQLVLEMKKAIFSKNHFVLETPLSHPDYWSYIDLFDNNAYQIQLNYLCVDKVADCISRVEQRVLEGGHHVEPNTIKGVYQKNLEYIDEYRRTFKIIELYDGMKVPTLLVRIEDQEVNFAEKLALNKKWITTGMPLIAKSIKAYLKNESRPRTK